jgi:NifB/MoaA-like Fe-S oxidoreductase
MTTIKQEPFELTCRHDISVFDGNPLHAQSYKIIFEILETSHPDIPKELLLFRKVSNQLIELTKEITYYDKFVTVCSVSDIYAYPALEPDCSMKESYFRKSRVEGVLGSMEKCYEVLNRMEELLMLLLRNIRNIQENMVETPPYKIKG